jgi:hypothetical protein
MNKEITTRKREIDTETYQRTPFDTRKDTFSISLHKSEFDTFSSTSIVADSVESNGSDNREHAFSASSLETQQKTERVQISTRSTSNYHSKQLNHLDPATTQPKTQKKSSGTDLVTDRV